MKVLSKSFSVAALALIALLVFGGWAKAETILQYSFGQAGPTTEIAGVTGGDIANGGSLSALLPNAGDGYGSDPVLHTNPGTGASQTIATAFSTDNYFYFTLTPDSGTTLDLTSLSFNVARGGDSSLPRNYGVRSSATGTADLSSGAVATVRTTWTPITVDLSTYTELQNVTSEVTFLFAVATLSSGNSLEWDDITIEGAVVPEPSTFVLTALGLLGFAFYGRRRKNRVS